MAVSGYLCKFEVKTQSSGHVLFFKYLASFSNDILAGTHNLSAEIKIFQLRT